MDHDWQASGLSEWAVTVKHASRSARASCVKACLGAKSSTGARAGAIANWEADAATGRCSSNLHHEPQPISVDGL